MTRENILKKIEEFIGKHCRCCDFSKHYYDDSILSLFIEFGEELVGEDEELPLDFESPEYQEMENYEWDARANRNQLRSELRQKLAELGGK